MSRKRSSEKHIGDKVTKNEKVSQKYALLPIVQEDLLLKKQRECYRI